MSGCAPMFRALNIGMTLSPQAGLNRNIKVGKQKIIHGKEKFEEKKEGEAFSA